MKRIDLQGSFAVFFEFSVSACRIKGFGRAVIAPFFKMNADWAD